MTVIRLQLNSTVVSYNFKEQQVSAPQTSATPFLYLAKPGLMCAAQYTEDDLWYRAEILETLQPNSVMVRYIDFGNREWLDCKRWIVGCGSLYCIWLAVCCVRLCVLPLEMIGQPSYCHRCRLNNLYPLVGSEWNMSLISRFKGIAMETEFQIKVKKMYSVLNDILCT